MKLNNMIRYLFALVVIIGFNDVKSQNIEYKQKMDSLFNELEKLHKPTPKSPSLPTEKEIKEFELKHKIKFPESFRIFLLRYSNLNVGHYEPFMINKPEYPYLDFDEGVKDARAMDLPTRYFPFLHDNSDYFCFDLNSNKPDYEVIYWSHDGMFKEERWNNFLDWVENCWIIETKERLND